MVNDWDSYRARETTKVTYTLGDIGMPNTFIVIRNPLSMTPAELSKTLIEAQKKSQKRLRALSEEYTAKEDAINSRADDGDITEDERFDQILDLSSGLDYSESTILLPTDRVFIDSWNLTYPGTDELLPLPDIEPQVLFSLPVEIQKYIKDKIALVVGGSGEETSEGNENPKVTESDSEPS